MSFKKSKLDLLVRVRYSNPLPAPPCPPKLIEIPTTPMRYAKPEFLNAMASNAPLPMIVDAELGMPLDLGKWECLWNEDADSSALNPDPHNLPKLDPTDDWLANESFAPGTSYTSSQITASGGSQSSIPMPAVAWLRKTEYVSRPDSANRANMHDSRHVPLERVDISHAAQLRDIEASFVASNDDFSLESLQHPNKPNVTAVESYEILPDIDIWPNQYDLFRFSERPGERPLDMDDSRLDCAILRPMKSGHDTFLAYYLTENDESAIKLKELRSGLPAYFVPENEEETQFKFIRDYETVKVEQEVPNEFLLVVDEGSSKEEDMFGDEKHAQQRPKGAYYKNIERKMHLKKKRVNAYEEYEDKWEIIRMTHATMTKEEDDERDEALAEVADPTFFRDAEGEPEPELDDAGGGILEVEASAMPPV